MEKESILFTPGKIGAVDPEKPDDTGRLHLKACAQETRLPTCCMTTINRLPPAGSV